MRCHFLEQCQHRLHVDLGRCEQHLSQRLSVQLLIGLVQVGVFHVKYLPNQRVSVGVDSGGCDSDDGITLAHLLDIDYLLLVHDTNGKSGQIVFVFRIESRHLRSFTANQAAFRLNAAFSHALHDGCHLLRNVLAYCNVVQEKQRLRANADDVVHAHCHAVQTYRIVLVLEERQFQLGSHAVCSTYENRLLHSGQIRLKQASESSYRGCISEYHGLRHMFLHQLYRSVSAGNIHTCFFIAFALAFHLSS